MPETDDLRTMLQERTYAVPHPPDRLRSVHRRVAQRQRRRAGGALAAGVIAAVAAGVVVTGPLGQPSPQRLASRPSSDPGYSSPAYYGGGRRIAAGTLVSPAAGRTSFTFTPSSWQLGVACTSPGPEPAVDPVVAISVNGHATMSGGCPGASFSAGPDEDAKFWSNLGVRLGEPSTVTATLQTRVTTPSSPLPVGDRPHLTIEIAVYQRVPLDQYPLPPRPATLAALPRMSGAGTVDSRTVGADGTFPVDPPSTAQQVHVDTVAPGEVEIRAWIVDPRAGNPAPDISTLPLLGRLETWTWTSNGTVVDVTRAGLAEHGLRIRAHQQLFLYVVASRFTAAGWTVSTGE